VGYYPLGAKAVQQNPAIHVPGGSVAAAAPGVLPAAPNRGQVRLHHSALPSPPLLRGIMPTQTKHRVTILVLLCFNVIDAHCIWFGHISIITTVQGFSFSVGKQTYIGIKGKARWEKRWRVTEKSGDGKEADFS
jgi:hypothetical protein